MSDSSKFTLLAQSCRRAPPHIALVLGSGMGELTNEFREEISVPFRAVPGLEAPTVPGHPGALSIGVWAECRVLMFSGRLHLYEGHTARAVCEPLALAHRLGARIALLTNAAGGIRDDLVPGSLMLIERHIDWTRGYPWPAEELPAPFSPRLQILIENAARLAGVPIHRGVYAQVTGPCYETPAEIRALRSCGADAVGMSTGKEIAWAAAHGLECAAISCITNRAAGLCDGPINHEEVLETVNAQRERILTLIAALLRTIPASYSGNVTRS